jgi:hypothetical protein
MKKITRNPKPETRNSFGFLIGILILIIGLWLGKSLNGPAFTPATFAHKYYFYGFPVDELRSNADRYPDQKKEIILGVSLYEQEKFQELSPILAQLSSQYPEDRVFRFYSGLAAHYVKAKDKAIEALLPLSEQAGELQDEATWYAALSYVLFNESEQAIALLKSIKDGPYLDKAKGLIADLE